MEKKVTRKAEEGKHQGRRREQKGIELNKDKKNNERNFYPSEKQSVFFS